MIDDKKLARINELAHKKKTEGLTEEETEERAELFKEYLTGIRNNLRAQLNAIEFVTEDDNPENWTQEERENVDFLTKKLAKEYEEENNE